MNNTEKILELKEMLDDPRTGLKDSSNTNKTRHGILALFETKITQAIAEDRERMRGVIKEFRHKHRNLNVSSEFDIAFDNFLASLDKPVTDNEANK